MKAKKTAKTNAKSKPLPKITGQQMLGLLAVLLDSGLTFTVLAKAEREEALVLIEDHLKTAMPGLMRRTLPRSHDELDAMLGGHPPKPKAKSAKAGR